MDNLSLKRYGSEAGKLLARPQTQGAEKTIHRANKSHNPNAGPFGATFDGQKFDEDFLMGSLLRTKEMNRQK